MKTRYLLLLSCWLSTTFLFATQARSFTVLFPYDVHTLNSEMSESLRSFVSTLDRSRIHSITLSGHTDNDGSHTYNDRLSQQRTQNVRTTLIALGLHERSIGDDSFGERMPVLANISDENQQANRRVEIVVEFIEFGDLNEFHSQLRSGAVSTHTINTEKDNVVIGELGIKVSIPKNAFTTNSGANVSGMVHFELTETTTNEQFISEGLSTNSNGRLLETGGMVKLVARDQNDQELLLGEGQSLNIEIPTGEALDGMQTFVSDNGDNWQTANSSARGMLASTLFNTQYRDKPSYENSAREQKPLWKRDMRSKPRKPVDPYMPKVPKQPNPLSYERNVRWYQALRKKQILEAANAQYLIAMHRYTEQMEKYERKVDKYKLDEGKHPQYLEQYANELLAWELAQPQDSLDFVGTTLAAFLVRDRTRREKDKVIYQERVRTWRAEQDSINAELNKERDSYLASQRTASMENGANYSLRTVQMGWINCDRFDDTPSTERFVLDVADPFPVNGNVLIVYEDIRSMIRVPHNGSGYNYSGLPKGRKAKLLAYYIDDGVLNLSVTSFRGPVSETSEFKVASLADFLEHIDSNQRNASID